MLSYSGVHTLANGVFLESAEFQQNGMSIYKVFEHASTDGFCMPLASLAEDESLCQPMRGCWRPSAAESRGGIKLALIG
jgi:hypothetical protein